MSIKDKVAIVGMGCSKFGERWDCGLSDLIIEASCEAFEDAHVKPEDIQAVFFSVLNESHQWPFSFSELRIAVQGHLVVVLVD